MTDEKFQAEKAEAIEERITTKVDGRTRAAKKAKVEMAAPVVEDDPAHMEDDLEDVELSRIELRQIEQEERAHIRAEKRKKVKIEARARVRRKLEQAAGLREKEEDILIDLAPHAPYIMINGIQYLQGHWYRVPASLAIVFREVMQSGHYHQAEIDGKPKRFYTRRNQHMSPHGNVTHRGLLQV